MRAARLALALAFAAAGALAQPSQEPVREAEPSELAAHTLLLDVARAGDRLVAVGTWGHVVLSDDGGETWRQAQHVPTRRTLTAVTFAGDRRGWAVGHDATVLHSEDGGQSWELQLRLPDEDAPLLSVWFEDASHGIAVGGFGLLLETRDGGRHWEQRRLHDEDEEPHLNDVFAVSDGTLFITAETGRVFRSRDRGHSWQLLRLPYHGSLWSGLAVESSESAILALGMRGNLFRSDDLGDSWKRVESGTDRSLQAGTRLRDGSVVLVGHGGAVLSSRDGGRSFAAGVEPARSAFAAVAEAANGRILLFGEDGVVPLAALPEPTASSSPVH